MSKNLTKQQRKNVEMLEQARMLKKVITPKDTIGADTEGYYIKTKDGIKYVKDPI